MIFAPLCVHLCVCIRTNVARRQPDRENNMHLLFNLRLSWLFEVNKSVEFIIGVEWEHILERIKLN